MLSDADFEAHAKALVSAWVSGRVVLKCGANAVAAGLDHDCDGRARMQLTGITARLGPDAAEWSIDANILLDEAYRVPVLWFAASNATGEVPPHEAVVAWVQANAPTGGLAAGAAPGDTIDGRMEVDTAAGGDCAAASSSGTGASVASPAAAMVSCEWHPWTRLPAYCIHACRTAACLDEMLAAAAAPEDAGNGTGAATPGAAADADAAPTAMPPPLRYMLAWCSLYLPLVGVTVAVDR